MSADGLADAAKAELKDASNWLFFDEQGTVLASSFVVSAAINLAHARRISERKTQRALAPPLASCRP